MKIRIYGFIATALIIVFLTGCWDIYEIKEHTIVTLTGIDFQDGKIRIFGEYETSTESAVPTQSTDAGGQNKVTKIVTAKDESFSQHRILTRFSGDIFFGTVRGIVFSDSYARNGIEEYLNRQRAMTQYRKTMYLFSTNTDMETLFSKKELGTENIGFRMEKMAKQLEQKGWVYNMKISKALENMHVKNTGYLMSNFDVVPSAIELSGYSIIENNKKIGVIGHEQIKGVNYLLVRNPKSEYTLPFGKSRFAVAVNITKRKISVSYDKGKIVFNIKISLKSPIMSFANDIKIDKNKMKQLQQLVSKAVKKDIDDAVKTSQAQYGCDYLYFYEYFRAKYPEDFKNMNWNESYKDAVVNVDVKTHVYPASLQNFFQ